jgi:hypothetical protein
MANAKLIAHIVQVRIGRIANLQHLIQPSQITIAATITFPGFSKVVVFIINVDDEN